ncbi:unnamed protein product [Dracunculus medinensis]|uniref:Estradiol 17-beta-dehydrogenase 12 n=1 Tax=Dracunculus medinensis TaxID=318479 RepID=A0A0N4UMI3_DRAME|nr:unnamed protein product [Dracunculus medinensis]
MCICVIGWIAILFFIYKIALSVYKIVYPYIIAKPINLAEAAGGKWAVVTGSTDGIGKQFASQLARKGFSILLIARSKSKLDETKQLIEESGVEVKTIVFDFSCTDVNEYQKTIFNELDRLDVGILINNVGVSYEFPEILHKIEGGAGRIADINIVNTLPCTLLCSRVLSQMVKRNKGIIVNVSSSIAYLNSKMFAAYVAAKQHTASFTSVIRKEYAAYNIIIQLISPMFITTKMSKIKHPSFFIPTPERFVKSTLRTIGHVDETTGFLAHQIQIEMFMNLPTFLLNYIVGKSSEALNKKCIAKKNR